jgi:tRNA nucleotidyltransferase/poly(A) polymerase
MIKLPKKAQELINTFNKHGFELYAVGGSVRDLLLGKTTRGWDFATSATPEQVLVMFPDSFYDNQFGTVGIKIRTQNSELNDQINEVDDIFEVTTYRSEKGYTDFRHPDVITWGKTLLEDLSRRDFTINAIAFDGSTIIDPYEGQLDLERKIIRTVGNPNERFQEDALRMMRAVRQSAQLGFMIEKQTLEAIQANTKLLKNISAERIRDELLKLLASSFAADGVLMLKNTGILGEVMPELEPAFSIGQKSPKRHHIYDVGTHSVMALKHCPSPDPIVRFATLIHDIGKIQTYRKDDTGLITFYNHEMVSAKIAKRICMRLRFSNKQTDKVVTLVRWHQFTVDERQTDSALRRFIRHIGKENLEDMLALRIGDRLGGGASETSWRLELFKKRLEDVQKQPFSVTDLKINGFDIMKELGVKPGPIIGKTLSDLFAEVEAGTLANDRETLLAKLKELQTTVV